MSLYKTFLSNISILLALTYLVNILSKYSLTRISTRGKEYSFTAIAIVCGWVSMFFGIPLPDGVLFDLRFVPLIIAPIFLSRSYLIFVIGVGIGLSRLTFSLHTASWVGLLNMVVLGALAALLNEALKPATWPIWRKILAFILMINCVNVVIIALFGVLPPEHYLLHIAPRTFPASLLLSGLFCFVVYDFQQEYKRKDTMQVVNLQLAEQNAISAAKTEELTKAKEMLEEHTQLLMMSSQYKSEFLANMSHELRTPLNSLLILSQMLADNKQERLSPEEVSYAQMIHASGNDLLLLINDILDLSKIEAGHAEMVFDEVNLGELAPIMERFFQPIAAKKQLNLQMTTDPDIPDIITTDGQRLQQILKNLLSNALKFTESGTVSMHIRLVQPDEWGELAANLANQSEVSPVGPDSSSTQALTSGNALPVGPNCSMEASEWICFMIEDTGIGVPADKQKIIFDAFQQADGTTSRKYGGTGLGLSISREFAKLLGGFITLQSTVGVGSRFSLYLPGNACAQVASADRTDEV